MWIDFTDLLDTEVRSFQFSNMESRIVFFISVLIFICSQIHNETNLGNWEDLILISQISPDIMT